MSPCNDGGWTEEWIDGWMSLDWAGRNGMEGKEQRLFFSGVGQEDGGGWVTDKQDRETIS